MHHCKHILKATQPLHFSHLSGQYERYKFYWPDSGPGSSIGIVTDYELDGPGIAQQGARFYAHPDRPWGPPNLLYNGYQVFPGGKVQPRRAADHSPPSSAEVLEE
jgi:hypothetical protein